MVMLNSFLTKDVALCWCAQEGTRKERPNNDTRTSKRATDEHRKRGIGADGTVRIGCTDTGVRRGSNAYGLLYTAIRNKHQQGQVELVVFADDASKVSRVLDNLNLDFVGTQAGEGTFESTQAKTCLLYTSRCV